MKKILIAFFLFSCVSAANAQYNVGTSTTETDYLGRPVTTHRDAYGNKQGTSTTKTDYLGRPVTTYRDAYGNRQGTSTTERDYLGRLKTNQRSNNSNTTIWTW